MKKCSYENYQGIKSQSDISNISVIWLDHYTLPPNTLKSLRDSLPFTHTAIYLRCKTNKIGRKEIPFKLNFLLFIRNKLN